MSQFVPPRQRQALEVLLNGGTIQAAADAARVRRRTVTRWRQQEAFKMAMAEAESDKLAGVNLRLLALADDAAVVLQKSLREDKASYQQIRSASIVFGNLLKLRELVNFEERLAAIERRLGVSQ